MDGPELRRLIVRHRHVAPMLSVLLAGTDARVTITDVDGAVILDRQAGAAPRRDDPAAERHPIVVEGATVGWVEGPRPAGVDRRGARRMPAPARRTSARSPARRSIATASST